MNFILYFYRRCQTYDQYKLFVRFLAYVPRHRQIEFLNYIDLYQRFPLYKVEEEFRLEDELKTVTQSLEAPVSSTDLLIADPGDQLETFSHEDTVEYGALTEDKFSDVKNFLSKPYRLTTGGYLATNVVDDILWSTNDSWTIPSAVPAWLDKLRGFQGLKATLCLKVVFSSNNYSAGKVRLFYYPGGDDNLRKSTIHTTKRNCYSQLPGVDINMRDPVAVLKIPYKTPLQYYNMTENSISWGPIFLRCMCPYRTGPDNAQSVGFTIWTWLEDVELYGQTHPGIVTQGLNQPLSKTNSDAESKPISGFFSNSAKALTNLSGIPLVKPYLATPIWALNALKGLACSLGWSKPNKAMLFGRTAIGSLQNMANSDGERAGNSVALLSDAQLAPISDLTRDGQDEASINYIKSREACYLSFTWPTTSIPGDILLNRFPGPYESVVTVGFSENYYSPIAYLGRYFTLWRGGITYRLEFIKTPLHRGQVAIIFQAGPSVVPTLATSTYMYREIVDLDECDSVEFTVPYINGIEWLPAATPSGRLDIMVITPLIAPETVASTIDVLVYVKGHESLQYAIPLQPRSLVPYVTQSLDKPGQYVTQSLDVSNAKLSKKVVGFIGNAVQNTMGIGFPARCTSEYVSSLLQLAKRHALFDNLVATAGNPYMVINPYTLPVEAAGAQSKFNFFLSGLCAPFAFIRGGMEMNITSTTVGAFPQIVTYLKDQTNPVNFPASRIDPNAITICNNVNGGILVECPFYCVNRASAVYYTPDAVLDTFSFNAPRNSIQFDYVQSTSVISRAVADDFQFLFFVGIPRMSGTVS